MISPRIGDFIQVELKCLLSHEMDRNRVGVVSIEDQQLKLGAGFPWLRIIEHHPAPP